MQFRVVFEYKECNDTSIRCSGMREGHCEGCFSLETKESEAIVDEDDLKNKFVQWLNNGATIKKVEIWHMQKK